MARVSPAASAGFNAWEIPIAPGVRFEAFVDGLAVWSKPGKHAISTPEEARELFAVVVGAYALITGVALDWSLSNWVEATEASFKGTTVGFGSDTRAFAAPIRRRSRRSTDIRRAARLAAAVRHKPSWRLALRDVWSALRERGDDAFVFGYRAIEDVARALSGQTGQLGDADWRKLHQHLGTNKTAFLKRIDPLLKARRAAAHGNDGDPKLAAARRDREAITMIVREVVAEAFVAESSLRFEARHVRK